MTTIVQRMTREKWKYTILRFLYMHKVVKYYLKVDYDMLKMYVINPKATTKITNSYS